MIRSQTNFTVPAKLLSASLSAKLHDELRLFFLLKSISQGGKIQKNSQLREFVCNELGFRSEKTFYNHVDRLYQLHWIGDSHGHLYVRSTKRICQSFDIKDKKNKTVIFVEEDIKNFEEFLFSASVLQEINARMVRVARLMGRANQAHRKPRRIKYSRLSEAGRHLQKRKTTHSFKLDSGETFSEQNLSLSFLSDLLGLPKTRVYRLKKRSQKVGYIKYTSNHFRTCIPAILFDKFKKQYSEYACRSYIEKNQISVRLTDKISFGDSIIDMYGPNVLY